MELYAAVVHTIEDVQLLTAGTSLEEVTGHLARYVGAKADHMLWPRDGQRVRRLLDEGRESEAGELYFARVGERWEREYLKIERVGTSDPGDTEPPRVPALRSGNRLAPRSDPRRARTA